MGRQAASKRRRASRQSIIWILSMTKREQKEIISRRPNGLRYSTNGSRTRRNKHRLPILSKRIRKKKKLLILIDGIERLKDNDTHFFIHFSIKYFEFLFFFLLCLFNMLNISFNLTSKNTIKTKSTV